MRSLDLSNVEEAKEFPKLEAGGYVCRIHSVQDFENKEYLKIEYDISEGRFVGHFKALSEAKDFWAGNFIRSYKESALPFFKAFINRIEESNPNYKFDNNEQNLVGKYIGLVLGEEEYEGSNGEIKTRLYVAAIKNVDQIRNGNFAVPTFKSLDGERPKPEQLEEVDDDSLPF